MARWVRGWEGKPRRGLRRSSWRDGQVKDAANPQVMLRIKKQRRECKYPLATVL